MIKERPIIFSRPMVRAILDGQKTQTRRILKPQPSDMDFGACNVTEAEGYHPPGTGRIGYRFSGDENGGPRKIEYCPYGMRGDRLWVRESFCEQEDDGVSSEYFYMADWKGDPKGLGWKPSIHMPRCASRITLEIAGVRVERLQDITGEDAKSEGAQIVCGGGFPSEYISSYMHIWESINGLGSWGKNPWVWVISFAKFQNGAPA